MDSPIVIASLVTLLVAIIFYAIFFPKTNRTFVIDNNRKANSPLMKFMSFLGNDILSILPNYFDRRPEDDDNPKIKALLIKSGNPWNLTVQEYISLRYIITLIGFVVSWLVWLILVPVAGISWYYIVPLVTLFSYSIPQLKHKDQAKKRDLEFKRQLPEALDLITISLSGGTTFPQAVRDTIPNMKDGVLKNEFINIVKSMDTGKTLREALNDFADRAPNDGVLTFIRSVQSATLVNAPLSEILESRAAASREEFFSLIHEKTALLPSKIMMVLIPTMLPAMIIIATAPSLTFMMKNFGG